MSVRACWNSRHGCLIGQVNTSVRNVISDLKYYVQFFYSMKFHLNFYLCDQLVGNIHWSTIYTGKISTRVKHILNTYLTCVSQMLNILKRASMFNTCIKHVFNIICLTHVWFVMCFKHVKHMFNACYTMWNFTGVLYMCITPVKHALNICGNIYFNISFYSMLNLNDVNLK